MKQRSLSIILVSCTILSLFGSCSDNTTLDSPHWYQAAHNDDTDMIIIAKSMINEMQGELSPIDVYKTFRKKQTRSALLDVPSLRNGGFTFDWSNSHSFSEDDGEVLLIPLNMKKNVSIWRFSIVRNRSKKEQTPLYSFLYIKKNRSSGVTVCHFLSYSPERNYLKKNKNRKDIEWYDPTHTDYSGLLLVSSLNGTILHGINFENGNRVYMFRPNKNKNIHTRSTERIMDSIVSNIDTTSISFFNMKVITSNSLIRTYSYDDETYEQSGCMFCGGDPYTCECWEVVACKTCGNRLEECTCSCLSCNSDPCICGTCSTCHNLITYCTCNSSNDNDISDKSSENGGSNFGGGSTTGGSTNIGSGSTTSSTLPVNITGGSAEQRTIISDIVHSLLNTYKVNMKGINIKIMETNCFASAQIISGYNDGIGICSNFFSYSFYDQTAILWHEIYHYHNDDRTWIEKDIESITNQVQIEPPTKVIQDIIYIIEEIDGFPINSPAGDFIYLNMTTISDFLDPKFARNEYNAYNAEKYTFPDVSERYAHVRNYYLWLYTAILNHLNNM